MGVTTELEMDSVLEHIGLSFNDEGMIFPDVTNPELHRTDVAKACVRCGADITGSVSYLCWDCDPGRKAVDGIICDPNCANHDGTCNGLCAEVG